MSGTLWTPSGPVQVEKNVVALTREEIIQFSKMDELARKMGIVMVCKKCDKSIVGYNNDSSKVLAVACGCTEFRYVHSRG